MQRNDIKSDPQNIGTFFGRNELSTLSGHYGNHDGSLL